jgi:hypothetical protein
MAGALLAAACSSEPVPDPPALTLSGVVTNDGAPLPKATLLALAYGKPGDVRLARGDGLTDANGAFRLRLAFDTLVAGGYYDLFIFPLPLALAELGLIDEYEFVVHPRLAGHGPTLFAGLSKHVDLKLVSRLEFGSGAVAMRYEPRR